MSRNLIILIYLVSIACKGFSQDSIVALKAYKVQVSQFYNDSLVDKYISKRMRFNKSGDTTLLIPYSHDYDGKPMTITRERHDRRTPAYVFQKKDYNASGLLLSKVKNSYDKNDSLILSKKVGKNYRHPGRKIQLKSNKTIDTEEIKRDANGAKISSNRYHKNPSDRGMFYETHYFYNDSGMIKKTESKTLNLQNFKIVESQTVYDYILAPDGSEYHTKLKNSSKPDTISIYNADGTIRQRKNGLNVYFYNYQSNQDFQIKINIEERNDSTNYEYTYASIDSCNIVTVQHHKVVNTNNNAKIYSYDEYQKTFDRNNQLLEIIYKVKYSALNDSIYGNKWDEYHLTTYNSNGQKLKEFDSTAHKVNDVQYFYDPQGNLLRINWFDNNILTREKIIENQGLSTTTIEYDRQTGIAYEKETVILSFIEDGKTWKTYDQFIDGVLKISIVYDYDEFERIIKEVAISFGNEENGYKERKTITEYIYSYY